VTVRLRDCAPVPHDLVHAVQAEKAEVSQWIGHGPPPHDLVSAECGHAAPPYLGGVRARLRCWKPPPHDLLQAV